MPDNRLAVTVLPGLLGAGKTTLLSRVGRSLAEFSSGGARSSVGPTGTGWISVPRGRRPGLVPASDYMRQHWVRSWGDRRQKLVLIGSNIVSPAFKEKLDTCLVPSATAVGPDGLPLDMTAPCSGSRRVEDAA